MVAFNKAIAEELVQRVPQGVDASTMHAMGNRLVKQAFPHLGRPNAYRVDDIIEEITGQNVRTIRREKPILFNAVKELVGYCKMNLVGVNIPDPEKFSWVEEINELIRYYDVDCNGSLADIMDLIPKVLERCKDVGKDSGIDFDDMIWLPTALNLKVFRYDLLLVDESQDLNRAQQALARKAGSRLVLCGDPNQAIYGFAGADSESMERMATELGAEPRGCVVLPLTVTRRCGKTIVDEARKIVPKFEAHETNGVGLVSRALYTYDMTGKKRKFEDTYLAKVEDGDICICRCNAPLVSQCFMLLKLGRKANILGRDVGQGLISTIKKQKAENVPDLVGKLSDWLHAEQAKEQAKRNPSEPRLIALQDRHDCLLSFTEGTSSIECIIKKIEDVFTDDRNKGGVDFSSIHKSKGLERKRVFLLEPKEAPVPHHMAKSLWAKQQEMNLRYVAITRAIEEIVFVTSGT
jgi:superfamily I DNA/RNA helicase